MNWLDVVMWVFFVAAIVCCIATVASALRRPANREKVLGWMSATAILFAIGLVAGFVGQTVANDALAAELQNSVAKASESTANVREGVLALETVVATPTEELRVVIVTPTPNPEWYPVTATPPEPAGNPGSESAGALASAASASAAGGESVADPPALGPEARKVFESAELPATVTTYGRNHRLYSVPTEPGAKVSASILFEVGGTLQKLLVVCDDVCNGFWVYHPNGQSQELKPVVVYPGNFNYAALSEANRKLAASYGVNVEAGEILGQYLFNPLAIGVGDQFVIYGADDPNKAVMRGAVVKWDLMPAAPTLAPAVASSGPDLSGKVFEVSQVLAPGLGQRKLAIPSTRGSKVYFSLKYWDAGTLKELRVSCDDVCEGFWVYHPNGQWQEVKPKIFYPADFDYNTLSKSDRDLAASYGVNTMGVGEILGQYLFNPLAIGVGDQFVILIKDMQAPEVGAYVRWLLE